MPGQLFNFTKYFKKDPSKSAGDGSAADSSVSQTVSSSSTTATVNTPPVSRPVAYSGIGNPPGGVSYSGIGNPPSPPVTSSSPPAAPAQPGKVEETSTSSSAKTASSSSSIDMGKRVGMDVLTRLTQRANSCLMKAVTKVKELKLQYIDTEHVLWGLLQDSTIYQLISDCKVVPSEIIEALEKGFKTDGTFKGTPQFSPRVKRVLELSLSAAKSLGYEFISPEHILLALSHEGEGVAAQVLNKFHLTSDVLNQKITGKKELDKEKEGRRTTSLEQFTEDLTAKAQRGELDPVVGRSWEIERIIHIISRRTKNNPVLIGDAGVGKTAIVEGLAIRISQGDVPETLLNKKILLLDLMSLIAGARHRGEFEERLKNLIKEVKAAAGAIILFIDELHNMVGAGSGSEGTMDASNILKPSLARGELQVIGTTTITEYRRYIEKDPALERRFQPVLVSEPDAETAVEMLTALRDKYEAFHRVKIPDETIKASVHLSQRYINDRFLPDKAVDLIDEGAASVRLPSISLPEEIKSNENKLKKLLHEKEEAEKVKDEVRLETLQKEIEDLEQVISNLKEQYQIKKSTTTNVVPPEVIAEIVSRWTNIPVSKLTEKESVKLLELEDTIHKRLINQDEAVSAVAEAVRRGRAGLKSNKRPIGSFIFMGPTGVGKTELAKALAEILFGSEEMTVRLDMSEYMEKHEVAKLIGAPPGYVGYEEGGQLTEAVRRRPYSVVLLDEIEKAHPDVFNILIQLLDDGRLTDNKGHTVSFKNTIVICTSNLGSGIIQDEMLTWKKSDKPLTGDHQPVLFKTYTVSPTGREIMTSGENYWEKSPQDKEWKKSNLKDYFAGCIITDGAPSPEFSATAKKEFPVESFDTHIISADGSETITKDDQMWFRTSTIIKEWTTKSVLDQVKGHMVINALPDKPDEQLPTAKIDTHAVSPANLEMITLQDRFWTRNNLQVKDWQTGLLSEYFKEATIKKPGEETQEDQANTAKQKMDVKAQSGLIQKRAVDKKDEQKEEVQFPIKKWDIHYFKPSGEEVIIADGKYWQRVNTAVNDWAMGKIEELFPLTHVAGGKKEDQLPIYVTHEEDTQDSAEDLQFAVLANRLMDELRKFFRPELLNRFDEVVVFHPLGRRHMMLIVDLQLKILGKLLQEQGIKLTVLPIAKEYIAKVGYDLVFGARPLRRTIQRFVENPISSFLIKGDLAGGDKVEIDFADSELKFTIIKLQPAKAEEELPVKADMISYLCGNCQNIWQVKKDEEKPVACPNCASNNIKEEVNPAVQPEQVQPTEAQAPQVQPTQPGDQTVPQPQATPPPGTEAGPDVNKQDMNPPPPPTPVIQPAQPLPPTQDVNPLEGYFTDQQQETTSPPPPTTQPPTAPSSTLQSNA